MESEKWPNGLDFGREKSYHRAWARRICLNAGCAITGSKFPAAVMRGWIATRRRCCAMIAGNSLTSSPGSGASPHQWENSKRCIRKYRRRPWRDRPHGRNHGRRPGWRVPWSTIRSNIGWRHGRIPDAVRDAGVIWRRMEWRSGCGIKEIRRRVAPAISCRSRLRRQSFYFHSNFQNRGTM